MNAAVASAFRTDMPDVACRDIVDPARDAGILDMRFQTIVIAVDAVGGQ